VILAIVFSSVFGIAASSLTKTSNSLKSEFQNYDYSYKYTASGYSANDTATISPWFAFDAELVSKDSDAENTDNVNSLPTITFGGKNSALKAYEFSWTGLTYNVPYEESIYNTSSSQLWINFGFGDVESDVSRNPNSSINGPEHPYNEFNTQEKYELVQIGEFGRFYRFNFESDAFKKSLIGRLYSKFKFQTTDFSDASQSSIKAATNIFDYMFYVNNSNLTDIIKVKIYDKWNELRNGQDKDDFVKLSSDINNYMNGDGTTKIIASLDDVKDSLNGRIGWILKNENQPTKQSYTLGITAGDIDYQLIFGDSANAENVREILNYGSYWVKNYESFDILNSVEVPKQYSYNNKNITNKFVFDAYFGMVGALTNFNSISISQTVMWDLGTKYRYISAFYNEEIDGKQISHWYNDDITHVYDQYSEAGKTSFLRETFGVSAGYAKSKNWKLGNGYKIIPGLQTKSYKYDGTLADSLNTYPTIYDEDILTDDESQAIFYLNNNDYQVLFGSTTDTREFDDNGSPISHISNDNYQDISRTFLKYQLNNRSSIDTDHSTYELFLANNLVNLSDVLNGINYYYDSSTGTNKFLSENLSASNIQAYSSTGTINLRSSLLSTVAKLFRTVAMVMSLIFVIVIIFVVYNIVKRFLHQQRGQLGNLKSLGIPKEKLIINFIAYMLVPVIILVPIGWGISVLAEYPIMNIFHTYFNIPTTVPIGWQFFLIEWLIALVLIGGLVWFVSWKVIKKSPLNLLNPNSDIKKVGWLAKLISKVHFKKFTSRMRATIFTTSLRNISVYGVVFFVASLILTVSLTVPSTFMDMSKEYYANVHYENKFNYDGIYANVPTTQKSFYEIQNNATIENRSKQEALASSLNVYHKDENDSYSSLLFNNGYYTDKNVETYIDDIYNSLLAMNGNQFSVDTLDRIVKAEESITEDSGISSTLETFSCNFIPKLFNQKAIDPSVRPDINVRSYSYCINQVANNIIPSSIKESWSKDINEFNLFSIDFGKMSYDSTADQLFTQLSGYIGDDFKNQLVTDIYGVDKNSRNQNLILKDTNNFLENSSDDNEIPITINKKMALKKYKTGDSISLYVKDNKLYYGDVKNGDALNYDDWYYVGDYNDTPQEANKILNQPNLDLTKLSYNDETQTGKDEIYYLGTDGKFHEYLKPQNFVLRIKDDNSDEIKAVNEAYHKLTGHAVLKPNDDGYYYIHPFDVRHFESNGTPAPITSLEDLSNGLFSYSWWTIALHGVNIPTTFDEEGNVVSEGINAPNIFNNNNGLVKSQYKLKIVGTQDLYDGYSIFMSQQNANKILGYQNPTKTVQIGSETINAWSNAKMSRDKNISDQFRHMSIYAANGDTSINGLGSGGVTQSITNATYVGKTKEVINKLLVSVYAIAIIFIVIAIVTSLVLIFLITDLSIGGFKIFMGFMRVQGYRMSEINSIVMWIFAPIAVISIIVGEIIIYSLLHYLVPNILLSINIAVPLSINIWMIIATFFIGMIIFAMAYLNIIINIKRIRLTLLTSEM
jgi:putative ABC transport system permease protein